MRGFNLSHINWEELKATIADEQGLFISWTQEMLLVQTIRTPTHRKGKILDLFFVKQGVLIKILHYPLSDHHPATKTVICCHSLYGHFDPNVWRVSLIRINLKIACVSCTFHGSARRNCGLNVASRITKSIIILLCWKTWEDNTFAFLLRLLHDAYDCQIKDSKKLK